MFSSILIVNLFYFSSSDKSSTKDMQSNVDISSLLTLDGVGIDVTFLKNMGMYCSEIEKQNNYRYLVFKSKKPINRFPSI